MKKNIDLSGVPPERRIPIMNLLTRKIERLWHRLENLSYRKSVIHVDVQWEPEGDSRWSVALDLELPLGTISGEANRFAKVEAAIDRAFGEIASKINRLREEKMSRQTSRKSKIAREDRKRWREELDEALRETSNRQKFRFLFAHLNSLRQEAIHLLEQLERDGDLDDCSMLISDII